MGQTHHLVPWYHFYLLPGVTKKQNMPSSQAPRKLGPLPESVGPVEWLGALSKSAGRVWPCLKVKGFRGKTWPRSVQSNGDVKKVQTCRTHAPGRPG